MNILPYFMAFFKYVIYGSSVFFTSELEKNVDVIDILALRFLMSFAVMWMLKTLRVIKIDVGIRAFIKKNPTVTWSEIFLPENRKTPSSHT